jgi:hypothetical protein
MAQAPGRVIDAALHLLDRQVVDPDEHLVCNVDDLELTVPEDGGAPYVTAILAGPIALGPWLGGLLGRWVTAVGERLHPLPDPTPARIDFGVVDKVESSVRIALRREDTRANAFEGWCRDNVVAKIPGAAHASE